MRLVKLKAPGEFDIWVNPDRVEVVEPGHGDGTVVLCTSGGRVAVLGVAQTVADQLVSE